MTTKAPAKKAAAKKTTAQKVKPDAQVLEQAIKDANVDVASFPVMVALHQMGNRRRAQMLRIASRLNVAEIESLLAGASKGNAEDAAKFYDVLADVEDMLVAFALDPERFRMWAENAEPTDLLVLMSRTVSEMGEASSSSS